MSADFLVEIGTEELPPKALETLSKSFIQHLVNGLSEQKICFAEVTPFASPRRLAVIIKSLEEKAEDSEIEVWGPPLKISFDAEGNPTKPALAFMAKNKQYGASVETLKANAKSDGKAEKLYLKAVAPGVRTADCIADLVNAALSNLPIPKRMRWGAGTEEFVRPVHWVLMLHGSQVLDSNPVMGFTPGNTTRGHRFHSQGDITINLPEQYEETLYQANVVASFAKRRDKIAADIFDAGKQAGGTTVVDPALLDEVTALNEWPVPLLGNFDKAFLDVPPEALISSMKEHQKYFHLVDANEKLLPHFITISNIESREPMQVIAGNEKVIRPRLADAAFFYQTDKKSNQVERRERLRSIVFQKKLGSIYDKTERVARLAEYLAPLVGADLSEAKRAAQLCKSDLVSEMVLEFDKLQGLMGKYYAEHDGESPQVAAAQFEHYLPRQAGDKLPQTATGTTVALADRLDTLVGIFGIGESPTGNKDPFALRRTSLAVIRLLIEKNLDIDLAECLKRAYQGFEGNDIAVDPCKQVLTYISDRFAALYPDTAPETLQAVMAKQLTVPLDIHQRIEAVTAFTKLPEAAALAAANKRVSNILAKNASDIASSINPEHFQLPAETALFEKLESLSATVEPLVKDRAYQQALVALAQLQREVDNFFDSVMVMAEEQELRANRLALLQQLHQLFLNIADISLLAKKA